MPSAARWVRQPSTAAKLTGSSGTGLRSPFHAQRPVNDVDVYDAQAAEFGVGKGVEQGEQADERFVRCTSRSSSGGIGGVARRC